MAGERRLTDEQYVDAQLEHRWRIRAGNGKVIAGPQEGYLDEVDSVRGLELVRQWALQDVATQAEQLCDWTANYQNTQKQHPDHEAFHFGNLCPYRVVADVVLRGQSDPRRDRTI